MSADHLRGSKLYPLFKSARPSNTHHAVWPIPLGTCRVFRFLFFFFLLLLLHGRPIFHFHFISFHFTCSGVPLMLQLPG